MINASALDAELKAAGIPIHGCASTGRIAFKDEATAEQRARAAAILAAHDPAPTYAELRAKEYPATADLAIALWERIIEGRPAASAALQVARAAIKAKYPKPGSP